MSHVQLSNEMKSVFDQFRFVENVEGKKRHANDEVDNSFLSKKLKAEEIAITVPKLKKVRAPISLSESESEADLEEESEAEESDFSDDGAHELEQQRFETFNFFNQATLQQLQDATGCTAEQAETIVGKRPFESYRHLETILIECKGVSPRLLQSYSEIMLGYKTVDEIIQECDQVGLSVLQVLQKWDEALSSGKVKFEHCGDKANVETPSVIALDSEGNRYEDEPEGETETDDTSSESQSNERANSTEHETCDGLLLRQPSNVGSGLLLKDYQLIGISWLCLLWRKGISGILADDMGLGKTAQVVCFLGYLLQQGVKGPHLVIVPSSTIDNWLREFGRWCPQLRVSAYRGSQSERADIRFNFEKSHKRLRPHAIVTTYNLATSAKEDRSFFRKLRAKSLILDEGHLVKNALTSRHKNLVSIPAGFRLLLTGTPLQNNLRELMALLAFILPDVFGAALEEGAIQTIFNGKTASRQDSSNFLCQKRIQRAKKMMAPFVMRRKKSDVLTELPKKVEKVAVCEMTESQRMGYGKLLRGAATREALQMAGNVGQKQLSNMLVHFRKMADHPLLFRELYDESKITLMARAALKELDFADMSLEEAKSEFLLRSDYELHQLCLFYKSLLPFSLQNDEWLDAGKVISLREMLALHKENGDRVLVFSQFTKMLDILEAVMRSLDYEFLRLDGSTPVSERQALIDEYNSNSDILVFLLSTKAAGTGINLASANAVILYDLDYNPHNDAQAENRAHRVGQKRPVSVTKLVCKDTIDEWILQMGEAKRKLEHSLTKGHGGIFGLMTGKVVEGEQNNSDKASEASSDSDLDDSKVQETVCSQLVAKLKELDGPKNASS